VTHVAWTKGGTAEILALTEDTVTLRSSTPSPPGSRIEGTLVADVESDVKVKVRFKVHGSKRQEDGTFVLEGRPIDLPKDLRERLRSALRS
jgi:hypothetical protein